MEKLKIGDKLRFHTARSFNDGVCKVIKLRNYKGTRFTPKDLRVYLESEHGYQFAMWHRYMNYEKEVI